jgi:YaiO family outer membrane protein
VKSTAADDRQPPYRLELGGYGNYVTRGFGTWRGADAQFWIRKNRFFVPAFLFESQTRPSGTQQNFAFFPYLNWTGTFYTTQGISVSPRKPLEATFFPRYRYDVKGHYKLPPSRNFLLTAGYTRFDFGPSGHGDIFSAGWLQYYRKWVVEGNGYINRNNPGALISGSGSLTVQHGAEGKSWLGATAGGGRELYRYLGEIPIDVSFSGYSVRIFYRKWLSRNVGVFTAVDYQDRRDAFRKIGGSMAVFIEF